MRKLKIAKQKGAYKMKKIVASLCDGMSCGAIALDRLGLMDNDVEYHAFEIDKYAEAVSRMNYPEIIRHGDARNYTKLIGKDVFLLMGGFPCQPYSRALSGKGKGDADKRDLSTLIVDALRDLKPKYFLFENVPMKPEDELRITMGITDAYGGQDFVEPIMINSQDFSAHHRKRLYWTNLPIREWEDRGLVIADILDCDAPQKGGELAEYWGVRTTDSDCHHVGNAKLKGYDIIKRVYGFTGKAPTLTTCQGGWRQAKVQEGDTHWRVLSPLEYERLQTVPDYYTSYGLFEEGGAFKPISNSQRYKMLGNGWTVDVITHILSTLK